MPRLSWDNDNERSYEYGISHGVLYLKKDNPNDGTTTEYMPGVAWNGLTSVDIEPDGFDMTTLGNDGFIYDNLYTPEYLSGTIESYGYPQVFTACIGRNNPTNGVYVGQQKHKKFGLCYRSEVNGGYIIHAIYNCTVHPSEETRETIGDSTDAMEYSWKFDTIPVEHDDFIPFSEITFDSRQLPADKLQLLEDMLYGSSENYPTLLNPDALLRLVDSGDVPSPWPSGVSPIGLTINQNGIYSAPVGYAYTPVSVNVPVGDADSLIEGIIDSYTGNATHVNTYAFYSCDSLIAVSFPLCSYIATSAFSHCSSLTTAMFPVCKNIGYRAFYSCEALTTISFPLCSYVDESAFYNCNLSEASFPVCEYIGGGAFMACRNLISVDFPACSNIAGNAFRACEKLTVISFPVCESVGYQAFYSCYRLTTVSFPLCSYIENMAFYYCTRLESVYLLSTSIIRLNAPDAFFITPISNSTVLGYFGSIFVPASLVDAYKSAPNWSYYSDRITAYIEE